jgi:nucleoside-diphosphate-sugar epimerase
LDPVAIANAISGADFVIHAAAPTPIDFPEKFEDVSKATIDGTMSVLRAC